MEGTWDCISLGRMVWKNDLHREPKKEATSPVSSLGVDSPANLLGTPKTPMVFGGSSWDQWFMEEAPGTNCGGSMRICGESPSWTEAKQFSPRWHRDLEATCCFLPCKKQPENAMGLLGGPNCVRFLHCPTLGRSRKALRIQKVSPSSFGQGAPRIHEGFPQIQDA